MAVVVDNEKQDTMPTSPKISDDNYYKVEVECPNSDTMAEWDYNAWKLKLSYVESNSKCTLKFTSGMSKSDYDEYIKSGVALRRNTYRGKDITKYKELPEDDPMNLYKQISNCTFDDIYVGDYINGSNEITYLIADLNNYLYTFGLKKCHATIIINGSLTSGSSMNSANSTLNGYYNSDMKKNILPKLLEEKIKPDFDEHIMTYENNFTTEVSTDIYNKFGKENGGSSKSEKYSSQIDLMNEVNVYGTIVASSSLFDIGVDNRQYAIFRLKPELISTDKWGTQFGYWLKDIVSISDYAYVASSGAASYAGASIPLGVRPRFLID